MFCIARAELRLEAPAHPSVQLDFIVQEPLQVFARLRSERRVAVCLCSCSVIDKINARSLRCELALRPIASTPTQMPCHSRRRDGLFRRGCR